MDVSQMINIANSLAAQNNAWSAQQAQKQMDFQERMSSTSHQREVADLKAAGLNPVLSAHSNGASSPTGAMGGTDNSNVSAVVSLLQEFGQAIAQATAKGAALGAVTGTETSEMEKRRNEQIDNILNHMRSRNSDGSINNNQVSKEDARLLQKWYIESGQGLSKQDYIDNAITAASMAAPLFTGVTAPVLTIPAIIGAVKQFYNNAKKAAKGK